MRPSSSAPSPPSPPRASPRGEGSASLEPLSPSELASLLERTSRTFALTIPLLDEPLRTDVGLAYLLLRIADTLEDAPSWGRDARKAALDSFGVWLASEHDERAWFDAVAALPPTGDAGCIALLARAQGVRSAVAERGEPPARAMMMHVVRTSSKMAEFVARQTDEGGLVLRDLEDLRAYCYAVAGIVGELLTDLFVARAPELEPAKGALMKLAPAFGEALQLVNILKDAKGDAGEGRSYLPPGVERADVFSLARADLAQANEYIGVLARAGGSSHARRFCELPVRLAEATLDRLEEGKDKLTREEVMAIFVDVTHAA